MPIYIYTYNAGTAREWKTRNDWPNDEAALRMAEKRTGAIDQTIDVQREEPSAQKTPLGRWAMVNGKREWTGAK